MRAVYLIDGTEIPVTDEQERKLTGLIRAKKLPATIVLGEQTIKSLDILGFTDIVADTDHKKEMPPIKSFEELRQFVQAQPWYKGKRLAPKEPRSPDTVGTEKISLR